MFDTKAFKASVTKAQQTLSFCGVNAHHQNGKSEQRIKDVTEGTRTSLLHAAHRWPKAVSPSLRPAALKNYVNLKNSLPTIFVPGGKDGRGKLGLTTYYETFEIVESSPVHKRLNQTDGTDQDSFLLRFQIV